MSYCFRKRFGEGERLSEKQERLGDDIYFYLKDEEYGFLSNFYPSPFIIEETTYKTVEHFYQSMKTDDPLIRDWINNAPKPYLAMKAGKYLIEKDGFIKNWENMKTSYMKIGLLAKFDQNQDLRNKLLETGNARLHEKSPTDLFWGYLGADMLGLLLMDVRNSMRIKYDEKEGRD